ncbi:MAG: PBP1A family penicillin-binding protein [Syntrophales bacterium]|nr:PBP1A family penicillin-binding protein [Syntrophales bacterium]
MKRLFSGKVRGFTVVTILITVFLLSLVIVGGGVFIYLIFSDLPTVATLKDYRPSVATRVYADNNELIHEFYLENRKVIHISQIPKVVIYAFVAAEDNRFFEHRGVDLLSILRAFVKNLSAGRIVQGGSTITQQVARSLFLTPERSYFRKLKEVILAYKIDRYLTKEEILNLYLNQIYLGHGTYGVEAAAQGYFGKSARDLTLPEAALLAGLPKAPSAYSPYTNFEKAKQRQAYVLERMFEDGYITKEEKDRALATPLRFRSLRPKEKIAPYFIEYVRQYLLERYGADAVYRDGLEVYTTLNIQMQKIAQEAVERGLRELEDRQKYERGVVQGALVAMDVKTGAIKAMVGGRDFSKSEFNRAVQARRQPGSAFKPLIYTAAFDKGLTPLTTFMDEPLQFPDPSRPGGVWQPRNFDGKFLGPTTLHSALVHSRNIITIKVLQAIGLDYAAAYAANMGITSPLVRNLSLALGSSEVTLLELVRAYGVLANQGRRVVPYGIAKVMDRTGNVLEEHQVVQEQVIDARIAYITTCILQDVIRSGTGWRVRAIARPVAGKTGTTNDMRDAWFIGYTPNVVAGVWVGFDQERSLGSQEVGGRAAAPIWLYFMEKALKGIAPDSFPVPEGVVFVMTEYPSESGESKVKSCVCLIEGTVPPHLDEYTGYCGPLREDKAKDE